MKFNLLSLHKEYDIHPRSWICIKGNEIKELVFELENEIKLQYSITREELSRLISKKFNCSHTVVKKILQGKKDFYPIPVILEMTRLCKNKIYLSKIAERIEFLKVNSASSKSVTGIKTLKIDLAKIVGAFMADGSLSYQIIIASKNHDIEDVENTLKELKVRFSGSYSKTRKEYFISFYPNYGNFYKIEELIKLFVKKFQVQTHMQIEVTDEYKNSIEAFNRWTKNCFGIEPTSFKKRGNTWRSIYSNKIFGRYLICFFDVKSGYKADIAFEPEVIKKSSINIRKAFALGVLTFDGSCTIAGNISLETKSENLFNSISNILELINVSFGTRFSREMYNITTYKGNNFQRLNGLFEKNTVKWLRFKESYTKVGDSNFQLRYKKFSQSKITFNELIELLKNLRSCDINFLTTYFNCAHTSIVHYLNVLKNNNQIRLSNRPLYFNSEFVSPKTTVYLKEEFHNKIFDKIKDEFIEYQKFGRYINVDHGTISSWKIRKNRIPLPEIKRFCDILKIDSSEINTNIEETDRRIVEII